MSFLALFVTLPTKASTGRMRVWRALKALGCATLRDGVYLLPESSENAKALEDVAAEAIEAEGGAEMYRLCGQDDAQEASLQGLFDRSDDYAGIAEEARILRNGLSLRDAPATSRKIQSLLRRFEQVVRIDFFPGEAQRQVLDRLDELRDAASRLLSPDEPTADQTCAISRLDPADYRGRIWATRARPWVDRLASAWLIRRYVDPNARIVWLATPAECRPDWLGFDFDGATFSHVGAKVTFEVLLTSFGLETEPGLARVGELVHSLDVGGLPVPEAPGFESLLAGLYASEQDDDALLERASHLFDWLLQSYKEQK